MIENITLIELTQNQVALIDTADAPLIQQYKWCYLAFGAAQARVNGERVLMHRLIMQPAPDEVVDHINHNRNDNRRSNLRICTSEQNSANRLPDHNKAFKGVNERKSRNRTPANTRTYRRMKPNMKQFAAKVTSGGVIYECGAFPTAELAARAYDVKAKELFGEYAYLNFPDDDNVSILQQFFADHYPDKLVNGTIPLIT